MGPWLGRKKIAFIPVHRPNAHPPDDPVPADWPNEIMRRILFDPSPSSGADRSLRAFILAASSGRADLDAVVLPMQVLDQQDVPPNAFEAKFGNQLRSQGFAAGALVMLGQPPSGTAEFLGGFWSRFVMAEGVGVWAMEIIHCLGPIDDLYTFGGNMGKYEEMAGAAGSHPSAHTKALAGWLDQSAIAQHSKGHAHNYDLHSIGLVQPPPSGRVAAVRIGSQVPFLMVEARQMVDQFDGLIPTQGVIVYRVQTSDPHGTAQNALAPLHLLTLTNDGRPTALQVGQSFTSGPNLTIQVNKAIAGGFSVTVDDSLNGVGFVTFYEAERQDPDQPPGPHNQVIETIEIDSMLGFVFTSVGGPHYKAIVKNATDNNLQVRIAYVATGPQSGRIISVTLA